MWRSGVYGTGWNSRGARQSSWQWQPTLTVHDPNPPITLEDVPAAITFTATYYPPAPQAAQGIRGIGGAVAPLTVPQAQPDFSVAYYPDTITVQDRLVFDGLVAPVSVPAAAASTDYSQALQTKIIVPHTVQYQEVATPPPIIQAAPDFYAGYFPAKPQPLPAFMGDGYVYIPFQETLVAIPNAAWCSYLRYVAMIPSGAYFH